MSEDKNSPVEDNAQDLKIEDFANQQLAKARTSLRVTQLITGVIALLAVFYVYVYSQLKPWLDPKHLSNEALAKDPYKLCEWKVVAKSSLLGRGPVPSE